MPKATIFLWKVAPDPFDGAVDHSGPQDNITEDLHEVGVGGSGLWIENDLDRPARKTFLFEYVDNPRANHIFRGPIPDRTNHVGFQLDPSQCEAGGKTNGLLAPYFNEVGSLACSGVVRVVPSGFGDDLSAGDFEV